MHRWPTPRVAAVREVLLSGENATLPEAELRALLDVHAPDHSVVVDGLVASVLAPGKTAVAGPHAGSAVDGALSRMALAHEWGRPCGDARDDEAGLEGLCALVANQTDGQGSVAVITIRRGSTRGLPSTQVERALGATLKEAGHAIDLRNPERILYAWLVDGRIRIGWRLGGGTRSAYEERVSDRRLHFSPVSLHPRRAASLLHLARVPPDGTIYDPFCGTGAFVLEAALEGYRVLASDLDPFMVQGTLQTLTDVPPEPLDVEAFVADIGQAPGLAGPVDGIVTDLPYGRASGTDRETLASLYDRALAAFAGLLRPGGYAVAGHPDPKLLEGASRHGLVVVESHAEYTHKSLTRHFAVIKKTGPGGDSVA